MIAMWNYTSSVGLLLLSLSICCWNQLSYCLALHCCKVAVGVDSSYMALRYTAHQLLKLKRSYYLANDILAICRDVGVLRCKPYIHHSLRRSFTYSSSDVVSYPTFLCKPQRMLSRPAGINYDNLSVPIFEEFTRGFSLSPHLWKSADFNVHSVNIKAAILSDIRVEEKLDLLCLVETWHKQSDGFLFNELLLAMGYFISHNPLVDVGVSLYNQKYSLSSLAVPPFNSFEYLVLSVSESHSTAIVTVYRPPWTL